MHFIYICKRSTRIIERDRVLQILNRKQTEIRSFGVKSLALFGSVARSEAHADSDVDLLVEFDRVVGLFALIALQLRLQELLGCPVDLGTPACLSTRSTSSVTHLLG